MYRVKISEEVFSRFPTFTRGIVIARDMDNSGESHDLGLLLEEAIGWASANPVDLKKDPATAVWNDTYRELGCNPNRFPPAHLSLLKRVQKPGASIPFINKAVAIMNLNSIKGILPVGGDDVEEAGNLLELRFAKGDENFTPLNDPQKTESPDPGEIIYVVNGSNEVMCRRWNWRNSFKTKVTENTKAMLMNIDGMGELSLEKVLPVRDRVAEMLEEYCGALTETALLSPDSPSHSFNI